MEHKSFLRERLIANYTNMPLTVSFNLRPDSHHQVIHALALMKGLKKHGHKVFVGEHNNPAPADIYVMWSWNQKKISNQLGKAGILTMERGFFPARNEWCSFGINGFKHQSILPANQSGDRWNSHFGHLLKPWKTTGEYALLFGQYRDKFDDDFDSAKWEMDIADQLIATGIPVVYRPHPRFRNRINDRRPVPPGTLRSENYHITTDLANAMFSVIFDSSASVESIIDGCPVVAYSKKTMGYDLCSKSIAEPLIYPEREPWLYNLAWLHWKVNDMESGAAWDFLKTLFE